MVLVLIFSVPVFPKILPLHPMLIEDVPSFQVNNKLEAAALMNWASGNESVNFQVGMKYIIDPISSVKVCMLYNIHA